MSKSIDEQIENKAKRNLKLYADLSVMFTDGSGSEQLTGELGVLFDRVKSLIAQAEKRVENRARYILHSILSGDADNALDHSDIEAEFEARLRSDDE